MSNFSVSTMLDASVSGRTLNVPDAMAVRVAAGVVAELATGKSVRMLMMR